MSKKQEFLLFLEQEKNKNKFMDFHVIIPFKVSVENEEEFYENLIKKLKRQIEENL